MKTVLANFEIPLQLLNSAVLYSVNGDFSSNACRKLKTISIKNRQDWIRAQIVLKLVNKIQMA